ncbi:HNH endonuclease [Nonomuraea wenchangensis]|uniref:HNH endonuclease n=1 Tax=Nonomuraea wenchangensis TaxID=568860 RepID=A0A1I0LFW2_9ACTN|nr:HNH endonuclease [Nonomuraea wenchangensis]SEU38711.1 HNH endonuclease [Nonomuraea wenchangensis]
MSKSTEFNAEPLRVSVTVRLDESSSATEKDVERFLSKVTVLENGCWTWTGTTNKPYGKNKHILSYGRFNFQGKLWVAHRWLWEQINGPVPEGLVLDHFLANHGECIGAKCVNPDHLEPTTFGENIRRGNGACARNARKTACPKGHEYDGKDKRGFRTCSTCAESSRVKAKQKAESLKAVAA